MCIKITATFGNFRKLHETELSVLSWKTNGYLKSFFKNDFNFELIVNEGFDKSLNVPSPTLDHLYLQHCEFDSGYIHVLHKTCKFRLDSTTECIYSTSCIGSDYATLREPTREQSDCIYLKPVVYLPNVLDWTYSLISVV